VRLGKLAGADGCRCCAVARQTPLHPTRYPTTRVSGSGSQCSRCTLSATVQRQREAVTSVGV